MPYLNAFPVKPATASTRKRLVPALFASHEKVACDEHTKLPLPSSVFHPGCLTRQAFGYNSIGSLFNCGDQAAGVRGCRGSDITCIGAWCSKTISDCIRKPKLCGSALVPIESPCNHVRNKLTLISSFLVFIFAPQNVYWHGPSWSRLS